jgi:hypothetical protein
MRVVSLRGKTGGVLVARYDWRLQAVWSGDLVSPELVALGGPLVRDQAERERVYRFAEREHQSGGAVWVRWFRLPTGDKLRKAG